MSLISRLVQPDYAAGEIRLPVHPFMAGIAEYKRGEISGVDMASRFGLDANEIIALDNWFIALDASNKKLADMRAEIHDVLLLGESGYYSLLEVQTRLGLL